MALFADRVVQAVNAKQSALVVGIDPTLDRLPQQILREAELKGGHRYEIAGRALARFGIELLHAVTPYAAAVKPQLAYFERFGSYGIRALEQIIVEAQSNDVLVIADGKRNDIGSTVEAYAAAYLGTDTPLQADALTVNAYLGTDGIEPFLDQCHANERGIFVLVKTSNPSSGELQDLTVDGTPVYSKMAAAVQRWNGDRLGTHGYGAVGAVVGATYPQQLARLRAEMPHSLFLVPGFGAQGGTAADVVGAFDAQTGYGALINSSRGIMYAFDKRSDLPYTEAQSRAANEARLAINGALAEAGRLPAAFDPPASPKA